uniref:Zinc finger, CCHC-type n=1 Tax=Tanacetum cinerariifolium TaxID=118510 RepID=A0A6L2KZ71_TANCI|nr:zinc finger, CCHC-type [Tanacetum cinerariifolium]
MVVIGIHVTDQGQRSLMKFSGFTHLMIFISLMASDVYSPSSQLKDTIREKSIRGSILSGLTHSVGLFSLNHQRLDKFEGVNFRRWQKKMHFLLSNMNVVYVLTTPIPEGGDGATMVSFSMDASSKKFHVSDFTNYKMTNSRPVLEQYNELLDFKHTLKHKKEELTLVKLGSHLRIEEPLRVQDNDKPESNNVAGLLVVNMIEHNNSSSFTNKRGKRKHLDTKADPNKKPKVTCWECGKLGHLKKDCKAGKVGNKANGSGTNGLLDGSSNSLRGQSMFNKSFKIHYVTYASETYYVQDDDVAWWIDSRASVHARKDRYLRFSSEKVVSLLNVLHVLNIRKNLVSGSVLNNCGYKQVIESNKFVLSKHGVFIGFGYLSNHMFRLNNANDNIGSTFMSTTKLNDSILWHARLGHIHYKRMQDMSNDGLISAFDMDTEKCKTCMLTKITKKPFQNVKRKTTVLELIQSDLCDLHATPSLGNKKAVVRPPDPKLKTLGERGIECIFVGYAEHSKAFRFYVIEPNILVLINSVIESRDAIFDENRFLSVPRPSQRYLKDGTKDIDVSEVSDEVPSGVTKEITDDSLVQRPEPELQTSGLQMDLQKKLEGRPDKGIFVIKAVSQLEYYKVTGCLMYAMTCTRPDITFDVGKLSRYTSNPSTQHWQAIQRISNTEDNSSTSGWVFLLGGGAISWASKKQTCITSLIMEYELVALSAASKEAKWLRNLLLKIPLWIKPIAPISIRCDSAATLAKAYSQMYNEKSIHQDVRHSMIRELIMNAVISIEFVRSKHNLADHLTNDLARDLVIKSAEEMGLKSNKVEDPLLKEDMVGDTQANSDSPILKLSNNTAQDDTSQEWSYLDNNEKKCVMLSARVAGMEEGKNLLNKEFRLHTLISRLIRDGLRESVIHLPILTDSIIVILILSSLAKIRLRS